MVVEQRYHELWGSLHHLREAWLELRLTLQEDRPDGESTLLVERLDDQADDGLGGVEEALAAVLGPLQEPDDVRAGGRALATAHERLGTVARGYWTELGSPERQSQLRSLTRRRGGEWTIWARGVDDALGRIPPRLGEVDDALRQAWLDLVERAIGQQTSTSRKDDEHGRQ
jgi:hypothetical protein